jgi:HAD superfamily hydrolase (TIGR01549 family)
VIKAVFFDVGYTLIDETRQWRAWAEHLRVPFEKFDATLREVIARGEHHTRVFEILQPGFDLAAARAARKEAGKADTFDATDLYTDALPCLSELKRLGYLIGLAGNQPEAAEAALHAMNVPADIVASSARWGIEKPSPTFFAHVIAEAGCAPNEIAYVGDRVDNDVIPASEAGMKAIFLIRGPWGQAHAAWPQAALAHARLTTLDDLPNVLRKLA